jgi:hypothetical protein
VEVENNTDWNFKDLEETLGSAKTLKRNDGGSSGILIGPSMAPRFFEVAKISLCRFFAHPPRQASRLRAQIPRHGWHADFLSTVQDLAGGHHEARTGAEGCAGACGIALCGGYLSGGDVLWHPSPSDDTGDTMMMSLYFTLGVFLLLAARKPSAHRSLIAFAAWSSFAHAEDSTYRVNG